MLSHVAMGFIWTRVPSISSEILNECCGARFPVHFAKHHHLAFYNSLTWEEPKSFMILVKPISAAHKYLTLKTNISRYINKMTYSKPPQLGTQKPTRSYLIRQRCETENKW